MANTQNLYYATSAGDKQKLIATAFGAMSKTEYLHFLNDRFHKFSTSGAVSVFQRAILI